MQARRNFPKAFHAIALLLYLGLASSCETIKTGSHFDTTADFSSYRSFSWIADVPYIVPASSPAVSPLTQSKIQTAIRTELEQKGYTYIEDTAAADFVVSYTIGARDEIRIDSFPADYRARWGWYVPYNYFYFQEVSAHSYTKGTLGVDIFDNESSKPVWHGWAEKTVTESDRADPSEAISEAVRKVFAKFP